MKQTRLMPILLLATMGASQAGSAQEVAWTFSTPNGGWIGITVDFTLEVTGAREETLAVVKEVMEGSPAEMAGIRVGDTITHLDGRPVSQALFSSLPETLEPGDPVRFLIQRQGGSRQIRVEAGTRPQSYIVVGSDPEKMEYQLQTLSGNILKTLDSLRLSIAGLELDSTSGGMRVQILRVPSRSGEFGETGFKFRIFEPFADTLVFGPGGLMPAPDFAMPFEAMIVDSRATASLKEELAKVRRELTAVQREELARRRELAAAIQGPVEELAKRDERILEIKAREEILLAEQQELSARLRQVSEEEMQRQWVSVRSRGEAARDPAAQAGNRERQLEALEQARRQAEASAERARNIYDYSVDQFRSPLMVGQNIMMGAQLAPMNPDLAGYFSVDEGVFVVQVVEDTPAFDAGLQGGDVIVWVAGEAITSLSDLRVSLGAHEGPIRIRVIRKGNPVEIQIRRE